VAVAEAKLGFRKPGCKFWPGLRFDLFLSCSRPVVPKQGGDATSQEVPKEEPAGDTGGRQDQGMDCIAHLLRFHPPSAGRGPVLPWEAHRVPGAL